MHHVIVGIGCTAPPAWGRAGAPDLRGRRGGEVFAFGIWRPATTPCSSTQPPAPTRHRGLGAARTEIFTSLSPRCWTRLLVHARVEGADARRRPPGGRRRRAAPGGLLAREDHRSPARGHHRATGTRWGCAPRSPHHQCWTVPCCGRRTS
ncbi:hypothetical protein QJS66_04620 [Kocuria rhizophila]|nr:hypothetical protein QJS66_04620 [Kocuria rhizophila]